MAERRLARMLHEDVPTLFEASLSEGKTGDVVLLGVPYEGMLVGDRHTLYPPGSRPPESFYARFGADEAPDAIRQASVIYSLEHDGGVAAELDFIPISERVDVVDAGNHTLDGAEEIACCPGHAPHHESASAAGPRLGSRARRRQNRSRGGRDGARTSLGRRSRPRRDGSENPDLHSR